MPELRQNPATKEWVIIATERATRPEEFRALKEIVETEDDIKKCPFCPGNESMTPGEIFSFRTYGTKPDTAGWWVRITPNKFPALVPEGDIHRIKIDEFFRHMDGVGEHEIIIETPDHTKTLATMDQKQIEEIFFAYRERYRKLAEDKRFELIILFKNHKREAGTSLIHPHSQMVATPVTPMHIRHRIEEAMRYFDDNGECVYCMMIKKELQANERLVHETDNFIAFIPFAATSPFETWVLPKKHSSSFEEITAVMTKELGYVMRKTLSKMHNGLKDPAYNFVVMSSPCHERNVEYYHWHIQIVPRVARVAGFEMGSGIYINTVIPENAAKFLRDIKV
ncbi:galactose-1-phosphate uridylyltransferase [Candidatus Margulisiibacteriota bacterium]